MTFGILTMATRHDQLKAVGLALSARLSNPGVPLAVACSADVGKFLAPYFDHVVLENPALRGFEHKVHMDQYSPFDETFFFDSDVLLFRPLSEVLAQWREKPYAACGGYESGGFSEFGLDRKRVLAKIGADRLVCIDGAGHAWFRKPDSDALFRLAREITASYADYAGAATYADEDAVDIAMTRLGLEPMPPYPFFASAHAPLASTLAIDVTHGVCRYQDAGTGLWQEPTMMHFAADQQPFRYAAQLSKLFKSAGLSTTRIWSDALSDWWRWSVIYRAKGVVKRLLKR